MTTITVEERSGSVSFPVRVQPRASRSEVCGTTNGALKVRLHAPPVEGAANEELIAVLAKALGVSKRAVRIRAGLASRSKVVEVDGIDRTLIDRLAAGS